MRNIRIVATIACLALLTSCALFKPRDPGIGKPVNWKDIEGWDEDRHAEVWPAILSNCDALSAKEHWTIICEKARSMPTPDDAAARAFMESWFKPHRLFGEGGKHTGLITGYYEPLLFGSYDRDDRFRYPLYGQPDSLLTVDLGALYPALKNMRLRGKLEGNRIVPFYSRAEIDDDPELLSGNELLWLDDRDAVFFLHIQGSGRVQLPDGEEIGVGYSNQNGHPYVAIGRILLERGELKREEISLFTIRQWLRDHPDEAEDLLNANPSYVFFVLRQDPGEGPVGSLNVVLTPERSLAIDPKLVALGTPIWLDTNIPGDPDSSYRRLVVAQDTGGAIKGPLRADLFWGYGESAEKAAGIMKEKGSMVVLLPKSQGEDN